MKRLLAKKSLKRFSFTYFFAYWKILCFVPLTFLDLSFLYIDASIPNRRRIGGDGGGWGGDQVFWKPSGVVVQVVGLVTVPGGSWGGNLFYVYFKLLFGTVYI